MAAVLFFTLRLFHKPCAVRAMLVSTRLRLRCFLWNIFHVFNIKISLQAIYAIFGDIGECVAARAAYTAGVGLPLLILPLTETIRTKGVVACQELGLATLVVIGFCTNATSKNVRCHGTLSDCKAGTQGSWIISNWDQWMVTYLEPTRYAHL